MVPVSPPVPSVSPALSPMSQCPQRVPRCPQVPPPSLQPGAIVAAPYLEDGEWYRARVLGTLDSGHLDLYYLDFGDNGQAPPEALRALRCDRGDTAGVLVLSLSPGSGLTPVLAGVTS